MSACSASDAPRRNGRARRAFSLLEVLVATVVLLALLGVTLAIINQTSRIWSYARGVTSAFRESRAAFEMIGRRVSQAVLNTYFDYLDAQGRTRSQAGPSFQPSRYARQSDLHFVCGRADELLAGVPPPGGGGHRTGHAIFFQAPLGFTDAPAPAGVQLPSLLNAVGYFIEYGDDSGWRPDFLDSITPPVRRYRLMQFLQGSERLEVFNESLTAANRFDWFRQPLRDNRALARPIAENVIAAVFWPFQPDASAPLLTGNYTYDTRAWLEGGHEISRNQLPPVIQVTLVVLDEASALRLEAKWGGAAPLLQPGALFTTASSPMGPAPSDLDNDLRRLTDFLKSEGLTYRVLTTSIVIRQAKFDAS